MNKIVTKIVTEGKTTSLNPSRQACRSDLGFQAQWFNHRTKFEHGTMYKMDRYQRAYVKNRFGCLPTEPFTCIEAPSLDATNQVFFPNMECFFDSDELADKREVKFNSPLNRYNDRESKLVAFSIPLESLRHCFNAKENHRLLSLKAFQDEDAKPKKPLKPKKVTKKTAPLDPAILASLGWA